MQLLKKSPIEPQIKQSRIKFKLPPFIVFLTLGVSSTVWFLVRVIPKPSRATYPCMQAAAPWASTFVIYLLGISGTLVAFRKTKKHLKTAQYKLMLVTIALGIVSTCITLLMNNNQVYSNEKAVALEAANSPMGVAKGLFPGRVVWVHNPEATNEYCTNAYGDGYFMDKNTSQLEVDKMLDEALLNLTRQPTLTSAWDAIFRYHNQERGKGDIGYGENEIVFIKTNNASADAVAIDPVTYQRQNSERYAIAETSPQIILSVLRQLVNVVGIPEANIYVGDPLKHFYQDNFTKFHNEFPNVHYLHYASSSMGREGVTASTTAIIDYSDRGTVLRDGSWSDPAAGNPVHSDYLYTIFEDMEYMINIPNMKGHIRAGVTLFPKNHFGSHTRENALHLHNGLVQQRNPEDNRNTYGLYRVQTDIMGHELLGQKNLVYLMDALYCSDYEFDQPEKWQIAPFYNDWTSSILLSQDPVAIESVCFDFLYAQYDGSNDLDASPHYGAVDDYMHQAADQVNWPAGIRYDPENDGSEISSLGVHEHWNNAFDKHYSRNLGSDVGIELVKVSQLDTILTTANSHLVSNTVNAIYIDSFNIKWFATDMGLSRFTGSQWDTINSGNHLLDNYVSDIAYERTSYGPELWLATHGGLSVIAIDEVDGITAATTYHMGNSDILSDTVTAVGVDGQHHRWAGTPQGLSIFGPSSWDSVKTYYDGNGDQLASTQVQITDIQYSVHDDQLLIGTRGGGAIRYSYEVDGVTGASTFDPLWSGLGSENVHEIWVKDDVQWYATDWGAFWHEGIQSKTGWLHYPSDSGLLSNNILSIFMDSNDNTWFGTDNGLSVKTSQGWYRYQETDGLVNDNVNSISEDLFGNIWIGTNGGVQWFDKVPGRKIIFPNAPNLLSPEDVSTDIQLLTALNWSSPSNAESYRIQIAEDEFFTSLIVDSSGLATTSFTPSELNNSTNYYWRVCAYLEDFRGSWSSSRSFTTIAAELQIPIHSSPSNGASYQSNEIAFSWQAIDNATSFQLQLSNDSNFTTPVIDSSGITGTHLNMNLQNNNSTYYWRLRAFNSETNSAWSDAWILTIELPELPSPILSLPIHESVDQPVNLSLYWRLVPESEYYRLQLHNNSNFNTPLIDVNELGQSFTQVSGLQKGTTYYWRVAAVDDQQTSWSDTWSFTTEAPVGMNESGFQQTQIWVYPNPASSEIHITPNDEYVGKYRVQIWKMDGVCVHDQVCTQEYAEKTSAINISALHGGNYILKLIYKDRVIAQQLTIQDE